MYQIPALTPEMLAKLDEARANVEDATAILQAVARKRDEDAKK
jgi:hypothetical protein